jgi:hypothetical protein
MPRTIDQIVDQADELAARFENHDPEREAIRDAIALREIRQAFLARAEAERRVSSAVERARDDGQAWNSIGAMLGTSGEAARQKYGRKTSAA